MMLSIRSYIVLVAAALFAGCGSDASDAQVADASTPSAEAPVEPTLADTPSEATEPLALVLPDLTPASISVEEPVPARELRDAVMALIGQPVTVQGEATSAFSPRGPAIRMPAEPGNPDAPFVECVFPAEAEGSLPSGAATVRGKMGPPNFAGQQKLTMTDCAVVESDPGAWTVPALADRIVSWVGMEVSVVGTFNGATTSNLRDGDVVDLRVQEDGAEGVTEQLVTCQMPAGSVAPDITERDGVIFQGTIGGSSMFWGSDKAVLLSDCVPVNR